MNQPDLTPKILECALLAAGEPLSLDRLHLLFDEDSRPDLDELKNTLENLKQNCLSRGLILQETASGFSLQIDPQLQPWISKLWEKRPARYSRALLETLALIAYRQPITRAEIEEVRGVAVASTTFKTLMERDWIRIVGHRDVPGKPGLYATTRTFLDYFNLKTLSELPALINLPETIPELNLELNSEPALETV